MAKWAEINSKIDLFQKGDFTSHAGLPLKWKIECDAISDKEWETLAFMISDLSAPFSSVVGIPRGGVKLANALSKYVQPTGLPLVVDDVYTTGTSFRDFIAEEFNGSWIGTASILKWCVFARKEPRWEIKALFTMPG